MLIRSLLVASLLSWGCTKHSTADASVRDAATGLDTADGARTATPDLSYAPDLLPAVSCEDVVRHQADCGRATDAGDYAANYCARMADIQTKWRADYYAVFFDCLAHHECRLDDDECMITAARVSADGVVDMSSVDRCLQDTNKPCEIAYQGVAAACVAKTHDCINDAGHSFSEEWCFSIAALNDAGRSQVPGCLALECSAVVGCLVGLGTFNP